MLEALCQYVSDLRFPPQGDSIQRRIDRAEAVIAKATGAAAPHPKVKCENCGNDAETKYDGDDMCHACAAYCAQRDFEEDDMPGGFA